MWANKWFKWNKKHYVGWCYVIESGSQDDHLHIHCCVELKSSHKHAELLKKSWAKTFPKNQLVTTVNLQNKGQRGEYAYLQINDEKILKQKLDYFVNEQKGEEHENARDLGLRASGGSLSYI